MESNPTEVYRVRMVSYENGIFMEMEPYEMYKIPKDFKTEFEKVVKICPSFEDTLYNFSATFNRMADSQDAYVPNNNILKLRQNLGTQNGNMFIADTAEFQATVPPMESCTKII